VVEHTTEAGTHAGTFDSHTKAQKHKMVSLTFSTFCTLYDSAPQLVFNRHDVCSADHRLALNSSDELQMKPRHQVRIGSRGASAKNPLTDTRQNNF
jgi:hypothetical protein